MEENLLPRSKTAPPEFELALWMDPTAGVIAASECQPVSWVTSREHNPDPCSELGDHPLQARAVAQRRAALQA